MIELIGQMFVAALPVIAIALKARSDMNKMRTEHQHEAERLESERKAKYEQDAQRITNKAMGQIDDLLKQTAEDDRLKEMMRRENTELQQARDLEVQFRHDAEGRADAFEKSLEDQAEDFKDALKEVTQLNREQRQSLDNASEKIAKASEQIGYYKGQIEAVTQQIAGIQQAVRQLESSLKASQQRETILETQLAEYRQKEQSWQQDSARWQDERHKLNEQIELHQQRLNQLEEKNRALEAQIKELISEREEVPHETPS